MTRSIVSLLIASFILSLSLTGCTEKPTEEAKELEKRIVVSELED